MDVIMKNMSHEIAHRAFGIFSELKWMQPSHMSSNTKQVILCDFLFFSIDLHVFVIQKYGDSTLTNNTQTNKKTKNKVSKVVSFMHDNIRTEIQEDNIPPEINDNNNDTNDNQNTEILIPKQGLGKEPAIPGMKPAKHSYGKYEMDFDENDANSEITDKESDDVQMSDIRSHGKGKPITMSSGKGISKSSGKGLLNYEFSDEESVEMKITETNDVCEKHNFIFCKDADGNDLLREINDKTDTDEDPDTALEHLTEKAFVIPENDIMAQTLVDYIHTSGFFNDFVRELATLGDISDVFDEIIEDVSYFTHVVNDIPITDGLLASYLLVLYLFVCFLFMCFFCFGVCLF